MTSLLIILPSLQRKKRKSLSTRRGLKLLEEEVPAYSQVFLRKSLF